MPRFSPDTYSGTRLVRERDINVMQISKLATVFGVYPHELIKSAESLIERARRGLVVDLSGVDTEESRKAQA